MPEEKNELEEKLTYSLKSIWEDSDEKTNKKIISFNTDYAQFMNKSKNEREFVDNAEKLLSDKGFKPVSKVKKLKEGDRVFRINRNKCMAIAVIGEDDIKEGCNLLASHIDSPRIDLKARPLYEDKDANMAVLKTHYYGGIKKYQWVNTPLAIHGKVITEDGEEIDLNIGESSDDPVFVVSDLLPHLSRKQQGGRKMKDVIKGEELNILIGGMPIEDEDISDKLKLNVLKILNDKYGMKEEDFVSAELELVPAGEARDIGIDRSMLGAYGHDDKVCGYTSMKAGIDIKTPSRTSIIILYDKEEIGSVGNTAAGSTFLESFMCDILSKIYPDYTNEDRRSMIENSRGISGDVSAGVNPSFKGVHEMNNAAKLGYGIVVTKFTGAGGKYSANDAHAEYMAFIRKLFNKNKVKWQPCELGKVDEGGGGTVAKFIAHMNMDIVDAGPALLGMHSPFEIASKADIYETYRAYKVFLES